jgi:N-acetylmuramoyl-L-alanine amidase
MRQTAPIAATLLAVVVAVAVAVTVPAAAGRGHAALVPAAARATTAGRAHAPLAPAAARPTAALPTAARPAIARPTAALPTAARPAIVQRPIPFAAKRRAEMRAYARRHYDIDDFHLRDPKVIVEHYTVTDTFQAAYATFARDAPDVELHELPGTCAHFIVDKDGTIYQLVSLRIMCRHTVGLNWTAFGIEQVGRTAREILNRPAQYGAVVRLTSWLRCRYGIALRNVIGHNESLSSPYHHENVAALRRQTHGDWTHTEMTPVRARLGRYRCAG